jgi:fermentation-respiration switch protein FrsA (DUF1100 family)
LKYFLILIILLFQTSCSHLFYFPDNKKHYDPSHFKIKYEKIKTKTSDGEKLHGYLIPQVTEKRKGLVLFFHGNAENISSHFVQIAWLRNFGYDVLLFDYRGYGDNNGDPSQIGTYHDALAMMNYAHDYAEKTKTKKIIFYGQSLGGVILSSAINSFKYKSEVDLLVLDSTFSSYQNIAFDKLTDSFITILLSPLAYVLVSDKKASTSELKNIKNPTLVIHSTKDPVVPYKFGKEIFSKLNMKKKFHWKISGEFHGGTFYVKSLKYRSKFVSLLENNI